MILTINCQQLTINHYIYTYIYTYIYVWLVVYLPLWKKWVRQLGIWHSQYMENKIHVPNNQPIYTHIFMCVSVCVFAYILGFIPNIPILVDGEL